MNHAGKNMVALIPLRSGSRETSPAHLSTIPQRSLFDALLSILFEHVTISRAIIFVDFTCLGDLRHFSKGISAIAAGLQAAVSEPCRR